MAFVDTFISTRPLSADELSAALNGPRHNVAKTYEQALVH